MTDPRSQYVAPAIDLPRFNCAHCSAFAAQAWWQLGAAQVREMVQVPGSPPRYTPALPVLQRGFIGLPEPPDDLKTRLRNNATNKLIKALSEGRVVLAAWSAGAPEHSAANRFLSVCSSCGEPSVWLYDRLLWPYSGEAPPPNPDLSADVRRDYEEAGNILDLSPRGAAALLRLAIQKLCTELGAKGTKIDNQIADLVAKGLPVKVQKALDIVRVVGNEAVHPGTLDLRDDRATAVALFGLVNLISEALVSQPKHVDALYDLLPRSKRDAIERRDAKAPQPE